MCSIVYAVHHRSQYASPIHPRSGALGRLRTMKNDKPLIVRVLVGVTIVVGILTVALWLFAPSKLAYLPVMILAVAISVFIAEATSRSAKNRSSSTNSNKSEDKSDRSAPN